jgi:hypothetical protein
MNSSFNTICGGSYTSEDLDLLISYETYPWALRRTVYEYKYNPNGVLGARCVYPIDHNIIRDTQLSCGTSWNNSLHGTFITECCTRHWAWDRSPQRGFRCVYEVTE